MAITIAYAATIKRNFEFDQLLIPNIPRWKRELKNKNHDKDSSEESGESDEKIIESSGINIPKLELIPGRKIHIGSNEGSGMDLNEIENEGSGIEK